jgi:diguanylate cyclase (GGDEF)-like protein
VSLKLREALQSQSVRDPLTKLFNRRYMEESLDREIHKAARSKHGLGVIMFDVDHFKKFNDEYGHDAGDIVLLEFANLLTTNLRVSDISCRYGGEEFLIIMPETTKDIVIKRAESLRVQVSEKEVLYNGRPLPKITASFGIAYIESTFVEKSRLIKAADLALYDAKKSGRNQVVVSELNLKEVKPTL